MVGEREKAEAEAVQLCLELPLYGSIPRVRDDNGNEYTVRILSVGHFQLDCYCVHCDKPSTFRTERSDNQARMLSLAEQSTVLEDDVFPLHLHCQRNANHIYTYVFQAFDKMVMKIGQIPSMASIASFDLQKYRPILGKEYFAELHRATGLMSHGVGIGSFVYLRRIFERLILLHRQEFEAHHGTIEGFDGLRMEEKIEALKEVLPRALVKNRAIYGILSKGVHELDEDTCMRYFPIVRSAILSILEEDYHASEKERAEKELSESIAALVGEIKGNK